MGGRRGDVVVDQRARLIAATLQACESHGWAASTVEELVGLAGVSKTSFYQHFANRDACFLATFEGVVEEAGAQIGAAYRSRDGLHGRMLAGMEAFAEIVATWPGAARLVTIDSLSLGAAAVPAREAAAARFEAMLRQSFAEGGGPGLDELTARALVGGVRRVAYRELRAGRPQGLRAEAAALVEWAMSYAGEGVEGAPRPRATARRGVGGVGGGRELGTATAAEADGLPWEEPPGSRRARRALSQRQRIVRSAAIVTTERGYAATSVEAISATAGVSKESFYENFEGKLDAFLAAYEALSKRALAVAAAAFAAEEEWAPGVVAGLGALLEHIAAERLYARLSFFELPAAGPEALDRADTALEAFTAFLDPSAFGASPPRRPPPVVAEAIGGGVWATVQHEIVAGRAERLPALAPRLSAIALRPFGVTEADFADATP